MTRINGQSYGPFTTSSAHYQISIPLDKSFRFVHEPVHSLIRERFVGRGAEIEELAQRLQYSDGGSFLITGYRGVGKTSFVNQVLQTLGERARVLDLRINLARPLQPAELMHLVIRRIYDRLIEKNWYHLLSLELQTALTLAYQRTSANVVRKSSTGWERGLELGDTKLVGLKLPFVPKLSAKRSHQVDLETSFLAYNDKAAEQDVIALSLALARGTSEPLSKWRTWWRRLRRIEQRFTPMKIVFVFDEMDKLDDAVAKDESGKSAVDEMLSGLKNLFTTSGICFLFVAGKDLHERWLQDLWRGDSVYESVFSYDKYLPCLWNEIDELCGQLAAIGDGGAPAGSDLAQAQITFRSFKNYLRFKGRGIPRRMLRAFNEVVIWHDSKPCLAFDNENLRRITFYSQLNQTLESAGGRLFGTTSEDGAGTRQDQRRLGVYYIVDWVLRQTTAEFTALDLLGASRQLSSRIALAEEIAPSTIGELLSVLTAGEYIEPVVQRLDEVAIGQLKSADETRYRLTPRRLAEMSGLASAFEEEASSFSKTSDQNHSGHRVGRYEMHEILGQGGMGTVYRAWDTSRHLFVALKILHDRLARNPESQIRFRRELVALRKLRHDHVVPFYDAGESESGIYLVMELIDGVDLRRVLEIQKKLDVATAIAVLEPVAEAIQFAHSQGFHRLDVKPNNIRVSMTGHVYLMDLGTAKLATEEERLTRSGARLGTPFYMAPEQVRGTKVDGRADIYSFGAVLYEVVGGRPPFMGDFESVIYQHLQRVPDPLSKLAAIPQRLNDLILRCLEKKPEARFQTMDEVLVGLKPWSTDAASVDLAALIRETRQSVYRTEAELNASTALPIGSFSGRDSEPALALPAAHPPRRFGPGLLHSGEDLSTTRTFFTLNEVETTIGRAPTNDISLKENGVSRYHAKIQRGEGFLFIDMNSSSGSYINGKRVLEPAYLHDGDQLRIGDAQFIFQTGEPR